MTQIINIQMKGIKCDPNFALKFLSKVVKPRRQRERCPGEWICAKA